MSDQNRATPINPPIVTFDPTLAARATHWSPSQQREVARVFTSWAKQLLISAELTERTAATNIAGDMGEGRLDMLN